MKVSIYTVRRLDGGLTRIAAPYVPKDESASLISSLENVLQAYQPPGAARLRVEWERNAWSQVNLRGPIPWPVPEEEGGEEEGEMP
jgi:hypothetical protein